MVILKEQYLKIYILVKFDLKKEVKIYVLIVALYFAQPLNQWHEEIRQRINVTHQNGRFSSVCIVLEKLSSLCILLYSRTCLPHVCASFIE